MPALALSDFLQDFGRLSGGPELPVVERRPVAQPQHQGPSADEIEKRIAAEVEKAAEAASDRLTRIYEETLEAERTKHAEEVAKLRDAAGGEVGAMIVKRLSELEERLVAMSTDATARVLAGFLSDEMQKRSIGRLAASLREAMADGDAVRILVRGPQSLHERLLAELGPRAAAVEFVEAPGFDLAVNLDGSLFETRLGEWSAALAEVVS